MGRAFEKLSLADAVGRLRPGQKVLLPPGSAEPAAFIEELCRQADRLRAPPPVAGAVLRCAEPLRQGRPVGAGRRDRPRDAARPPRLPELGGVGELSTPRGPRNAARDRPGTTPDAPDPSH